MRKARLVAIASLLVLAACAQDAPDEAAQEEDAPASDVRQIVVDYEYKDLASFNWRFLPRSIQAHPGETVVFKRTWTGEPHTVVFGTIGATAMDEVEEIDWVHAKTVDEKASPAKIIEAETAFQKAIEPMPQFARYPNIAQNAAQPCYLRTGSPPEDIDTPCTAEQQKQPEFDGKFTYYSSGLIPSSGSNANEFRVELSDDIKPGNYRYYCAVHFPFMQGKLKIQPGQGPLPGPEEVEQGYVGSLRALENPLRQDLAEARKGDGHLASDVKLELPLAGFYSYPEFSVGAAEFVPKTVTTKVDEPVTWTFPWAHTISFNAPDDLEAFETDEDGTVRRNPEVDEPAGGAASVEPIDFALPRLIPQLPEPKVREIDGGTWDGEGFFSSGLIGAEPYATYTLRVSEPGRYRFRCLIHPKMRGTLVVSE